MPRLKLAINLGTKDGGRFGLSGDNLKEGTMVDVDEAQAEELLRRGWAVEPKAEKVEKAEKVATPPVPGSFATPPVGEVKSPPEPHKPGHRP